MLGAAAARVMNPFCNVTLVISRHAQAKVVNLAVMPVLAASRRQLLLVLPFIYAAFPLCCIVHDACKAFC
jgi:hypothetical protein